MVRLWADGSRRKQLLRMGMGRVLVQPPCNCMDLDGGVFLCGVLGRVVGVGSDAWLRGAEGSLAAVLSRVEMSSAREGVTL